MITPKDMAKRSANLKIECTGQIDNTKDTYIYVSMWDSPKGTDKEGDRENEVTYIYLVRMVFWKTTHKKIWFATAYTCGVERLIKKTGRAGDLVDISFLPPEQRYVADSINTAINIDIMEVVEIKDWWLNAFRAAIVRKIKDFVKNTTDHRCCVYSMTAADHTKVLAEIADGNPDAAYVDMGQEIALPPHEKGIIHNSEFDYSEHFANPPTLCDMPISEIV